MKQNKLLLAILVLAFILRAYRLDAYPSLNPDEAALGYNAYSLLSTGKDEHGASWPLHFKSFGDNKPGGYVYLAIPFIALLDLTVLSVRLPNLILSILSLYFLYQLIFHYSKNKNIALLATFLITISPWHIHFSRGAWESSTALCLTILGWYFFTKQKYWPSALFFAFTMYTYHSARIITPLYIVLLMWTHRLIPKKFLVVLCLATLPAFLSFLSSGGTARFAGVGITSDQGPLWRANELINHHMNTKLVNRFMHNKRILYSLSWVEKYTSHYNLNFLFNSGDLVPRSKVPDMGQSHLLLLPFFILGLFYLMNTQNQEFKKIIFGLLLLSPIASSLTFQAPSALRSLPMVVPLETISAFGIYTVYKLLKNSKVYLLALTIFAITLIYFFIFYQTNYYLRYQTQLPASWPWKAKQAVLDGRYQDMGADQPYILYLFYTKYSPEKLQSQIKLTPPDQFGFSTVDHIDDIIFKPSK